MSLRGLAVTMWILAAWPMPSSFGEPATVALDKYGWWSANQTLPADPSGGLLPPLEVPAPPGAPEDGLYVESGADGAPTAMAAVSYYTGGGVDATLTLDAPDGMSLDAVTLAACPASGGWDAAQNGRWDKRPAYDPATCTSLGSVSRKTVTFSIPASAHEPGSAYLSVAIVPAEGSGAFSAGFVAPTGPSLTTAAPPSSADEPSSPVPSSPVPESGSAASFDLPPTVQPSTGFEVPTVPMVDTPEVPGGGGEVAAPRPAVAIPAGGESGWAERIMAMAALAAIATALGVLRRRPLRAPRLLGSLGGGAVAVGVEPTTRRGLGRFARSRTAPPTAI